MNTKLIISICLFVVPVLCNDSLDDFDKEHLEILKRARRVIGGEDIQSNEFKWLVHLKCKIPQGGWWGWFTRSYKYHYCGGSIVNKRYIMTAAHCFMDPGTSGARTAKYWHVMVGEVRRSHTLWDHFRGRNGDIHGTRIIIHPQYSRSDDWKNDIALLRLEEDLPINNADNKVKAATLLSYGKPVPSPGTQCVFKGWGCTYNGGPLTDVAQAVSLPISTECDRLYGAISSSRVCAGYLGQGKGICAGDSGGPLVCRDDRNQWVQVGIASYTARSNPGSFPAVFTSVNQYVPWINSNIAYDGGPPTTNN